MSPWGESLGNSPRGTVSSGLERRLTPRGVSLRSPQGVSDITHVGMGDIGFEA